MINIEYEEKQLAELRAQSKNLDLLCLHKKITIELTKEQNNRLRNSQLVDDDYDYSGKAPQWVANERRCVLQIVNTWRGFQNKEPITEKQLVDSAEKQAIGHSDYTSKYALYAAELAVGEYAIYLDLIILGIFFSPNFFPLH